ncbi:MAG TPA: SEC-C metal-binding domain-containing protein, partial [Myxococcota bacterium]|nr:SEC-C metal-binding domain-containing protein [Myxococcota bacterium]
RGQLDGVAAKHEELRARMALAETLTGGKGETRRLLDRIGEAGDELSREEFVALTAWSPIMAMSFLREMLRVHVKIDAALPRLLRMERARPRDIEHLRTFWRSSWAMGHLLLLAAVDDRTLLDGMPQGALEQLAGISTPLVRLGSSYLAVRAAWAIGRLGKPLLAQAKRRLGEATNLGLLVDAVVDLAAIGVRHTRLWAEVRKALWGAAADPADTSRAAALARHRRLLVGVLDHALASPEETRADLVHWARENYVACSAGLPAGSPYLFQRPEDVPEPLAFEIAVNIDCDFLNNGEDLQTLLETVVLTARGPAEALYLPGESMRAMHLAWTPERSLELLDRVRRYNGKARPVEAAPKPGRNEPCLCGSGKKYKRCCGA